MSDKYTLTKICFRKTNNVWYISKQNKKIKLMLQCIAVSSLSCVAQWDKLENKYSLDQVYIYLKKKTNEMKLKRIKDF